MEKFVVLAAANITSHPHPPGVYRALIEDVFNRRQILSYIGSDKIIPGKLNVDLKGAWGTFIVFTDIEFQGEWLNLETLEIASEKLVDDVNIPDNIRPNLRFCSFYFDFYSHKMAFEHVNEEGNKFSISGIQRALRKWFNQGKISDVVDVTIIPMRDSLERILSIKHLNKLIIKVSIPNPDEIDGPYAHVVQKLESQNARSLQITLEKKAGEDSLEPDRETKMLAEAASENGFVKGSGRDKEGAVSYDTKDHPLIESVTRRGLIQFTLANWLANLRRTQIKDDSAN
jgi:hypothetical protein